MSGNPFKLYQYVCRSRPIILEMLADRGFDVSNYQNVTNDNIKTLLSSHESNGYTTKSEIGPLDILVKNDKSKVLVKYRLDEKFKKAESLVTQIDEIFTSSLDKNDCLVMMNISRIYNKAGSKTDRSDEEFVKQIYVSKGYFVQIFGLENFLFNVSRHQFVPKHTVASKEEIATLMADYNLKSLKNLPTIKWQDPQAKYIGLKPKMIVKINCFSAITGDSVKYRLCIF